METIVLSGIAAFFITPWLFGFCGWYIGFVRCWFQARSNGRFSQVRTQLFVTVCGAGVGANEAERITDAIMKRFYK